MLLLVIQRENLTNNKRIDTANGGRNCANNMQQWQSDSCEPQESKYVLVGGV